MTDAETTPATIEIDAARPAGRIDRRIYGHFLEGNFFGNIRGGVFDEGSPLAMGGAGVARGLRRDVVDACRGLGLPVVRWPGGNYASAYHWEDGVGPVDARPRRLELTWGGQDGSPREEDNRFGTDEFLAWCHLVGAEPYLSNSCRSVEEAVRWVEYTNYGGDTHYSRLRAANGHPEPYGVRLWGLGNETYGAWQMGHRDARAYAAAAREHALFMRKVDPDLRLVAVGRGPRAAEGLAAGAAGAGDPETGTTAWTDEVLRQAGDHVDYLSIHLYGASRHRITSRTGDDEFETTVGQARYFEAELRAYADLVAAAAGRLGRRRPLALALDEWNMRHLEPAAWPLPEPAPDGGVAPRDLPAAGASGDPAAPPGRLRVNRWSPRTAADALFYADVFHAMQRLAGHAVPVGMANTVNLINANGLFAVRPGGLVRSATYYVWDLLQNHTGPVALPVAVRGPQAQQAVRQGVLAGPDGAPLTRQEAVPYLDAAATRSEDGRRLHLSVINRHRHRPLTASLVLNGRSAALPQRAGALALGADVDDVLAANTIEAPQRMATRDLGEVALEGGAYRFPAHSLTVLTFRLEA
jgi:alpha-N-arabinofuranosidase